MINAEEIALLEEELEVKGGWYPELDVSLDQLKVLTEFQVDLSDLKRL